ncbi:hypothetical protein TWF694_005747 [Orbilia ellipsospora]|uniref:Uncharacterized protein n=1 Tax=Orbilia ellipsospora TaxID=2528407 RepID=A0AAV9WTZ1_9PEZI
MSYMSSQYPNGTKQVLKATLAPYKYSTPVPTRFLDGYFLTVEPRLNCDAYAERDGILKVHQEWLDRGGATPNAGALSDSGGFLSNLCSEGYPRKIANATALSALGFIEDDWMDGEMAVISTVSEFLENNEGAMLHGFDDFEKYYVGYETA